MRRLVAMALAAFSLAACSEHYGNLEEREAHWRSRVATELRPGTSLVQVEAFFAENGLEHGYDEHSRTLQAIQRNVAGDRLVSFSVTFACQFNSTSTLVACSVSHAGTGP